VRKILFGLFIFVCLAVVAVLVAPSVIDWNERRDWVERRLTAYLGRAVEIEGDIDLALLPTPILTAEEVVLLDDGGEPLVGIGAIDVRAGFLPLVVGDLDIERLVLIDTTIELSEDGFDLAGAVSRDAGGIRLDRVTVENGRILWREPDGGTRVLVDRVFAQLTAESLAGPFTFVGSFEVGGTGFTADISTGRLSSGGAWPVAMSFGIDGSDALADYGGLVSASGQLQGELEIEGSNAARLAQRLVGGIAMPTLFEQPFSLAARVNGNAADIAFSDLGFTMGDVRITGDVGVVAGAVPEIALDLSVNHLDVSEWRFSDASEGPSPADWLLGHAGPVAFPRDMVLSVDAEIGALTAGGAPMRQLRVAALMADGVVSVSRFTSQLPGGSDVRGVGTLSAEDGTARFDTGIEVASGDFRRLLGWLGLDVSDVPSTRLRAFTGEANLTGTWSDLQVTGIDVRVDSTRLTGGVVFRDRGRLGVGARLTIDALNIDGYLPEPLGAPRAALADLAGFIDRNWGLLASFDASVEIGLDTLTVADTRLSDLRADLILNQNTLTVSNLAVGGVEGGRVALTGSIGQIVPLAGVDLTVDSEAAALRPLLTLLDQPLDWPVERLGQVGAVVRMVGDPGEVDVEANLTAAGGTVLVGGTVLTPLETPALDIALRATHPELLRVLRLIDPAYQPREDLGDLDIYTRIDGLTHSLRFDDIIGQVGPTTVGGVATLDLTGDIPSLGVELSASGIPVDSFLPEAEVSFVAPGSSRWSTDPFQWPSLDGIDLSLLLSARTIGIGGLTLSDPALRARLSGGAISLDQLSARLFGGTFGLSGRFLPGSRTEVEADFRLADADLARTLDQAAGIEGLTGTLNARLAVGGAGTSMADLIGRLEGDGLISVAQGVAEGLDLDEAAVRLGTLDGPLEFLQVLRGPLSNGTSEFAALNATLEVAGGIIASDDIRWRLTAGRGEGEARLDMARLQLDAMIDIGFFDYPAAPAFGLRIFGPLDRLERRIQAESLQAWVAQRAAEALTDRLRNEPAPDTAPDTTPGPGSDEEPASGTETAPVGGEGLPPAEEPPLPPADVEAPAEPPAAAEDGDPTGS